MIQLDVEKGKEYLLMWAGTGISKFENEKFEEAAVFFELIIKKEPKMKKFWHLLILCYNIAGKHEKVIEFGEKYLKNAPENYNDEEFFENDSMIYYFIAASYNELENPQKAIEYCEKAIEIESICGAWLELGKAYKKLNNNKNAIQYFKKSINLGGNYWYGWDSLGDIYTDIKQYDDAMKAYKKAAKIAPYEFDWNKLGNVFHKLRNCEKALKYYKKQIKFHPKDKLALASA